MRTSRAWALASLLCMAVGLGCDSSTTDETPWIDDGAWNEEVTVDTSALPMPKIPEVASCPVLANGDMTINGTALHLWVGPKGKQGPLIFYWHGTGMHYDEVEGVFPDGIAEVQATGGVVVSFETTNGKGTNPANYVWMTGDIETADQIFACAVKQGLVDPKRVHTAGYSSGGLQCGVMMHTRSSYMASVLCLSGGIVPLLNMNGWMTKLQDASNVPPSIVAHGGAGKDTYNSNGYVCDFDTCSTALVKAINKEGGFTIECDDGLDHIFNYAGRCGTLGKVGWRFFKENPFKAKRQYGQVPGYFPTYCGIGGYEP